LAGVLIMLSYTQWLAHHPWLCLVAPGAGFGLLMVAGTHFALTGMYAPFSFYVALVPFFLTNNLLLLNQLPDIGPDRRIGRRHFPIVYGVPATLVLHCLFTVATGLTIVAGVERGVFPRAAWLSLVPLAAAVAACAGTLRAGRPATTLLPWLGMNVLASVATPLVLGVALIDG
jgi:1,4-dihydroxy-2-naphthoate octaprenyltransferase